MLLLLWPLLVVALPALQAAAASPSSASSASASPLSTSSDFSGWKTLSSALTIRWSVDAAAGKLRLELWHEDPSGGGWAGFGFGEPTSGSMPGSDIVTAWFESGGSPDKAVISDRHVTAFTTPAVDSCQDWTLLSANRTGAQSVFVMERSLDTSDPQDRVVSPGPVRIVAAWGSGAFSYHGANRVASVVHFFGTSPNLWNESGTQSATFLMPNVIVPTAETTYMCKSFALPAVNDAHVVRVRPIIEAHVESLSFVHHMLVHVCLTGQNGHYEQYQTPGVCKSPVGDLDSGCVSLLMAWAVGMDDVYWPPEAGFRMGPATSWGATHIVVEIHYNNVARTSGVRDNSGIEVFYTEKLREHDSGVMTLGDPVTSFADIPAGLAPTDEDAQYEANCPSECTSDWEHEINVFGDFLHMHQAGARMWSTHWDRDGNFKQYLNRADFYHFDFQQETKMSKKIYPGDRINTHCWYDTTSRSSPTRFGEASIAEMCMEFVSYWPRLTHEAQPYVFCGSVQNGEATWCGRYDTSAIRQDLLNPTIFDSAECAQVDFGRPCGSDPLPECVAGEVNSAGGLPLPVWSIVLISIGAVLLLASVVVGVVLFIRRRRQSQGYAALE